MDLTTTKIAITFPTKLVQRLRDKAGFQYGFDVPEIVRKLAADYVDEPNNEAWHITPKREAQYMKDIQETKKLLSQGKAKIASSVQELRQQTEEENTK